LFENSETVIATITHATSNSTTLTATTDTATGTIVDVPPPQILDLHLVTNTNNNVQFVLMHFTDLDSAGNTYSTVIPLNLEGQQRDFQLAFDTGFYIDPNHQYKVTLQYLGNDDPGNGNDSIRITALVVEGVTIAPTQGNFQLGTGNAEDLLVATVQPSAGGTVTGTASDLVPSASGTAGNDFITGDGTLSGLAGNDKLIGGGGNDTLSGGLDSDILVGGAGNDALDGDNNVGIDTADYSLATSGVTVTLNATGTGTATGGAGTDTLAEIENVIGSNYDDTLTGSSDHNFLSGLDGNDTLSGGDHNDLLAGGTGNDILSGNAGNDVLFGGEGTDTLAGGAGADILSGGKNADAFVFKVADLGQGMDTITDFKIAEGDVLDVSAVLSGTGVTEANLGTFLIFDTTTSPGNTIISVDLDGTGTGESAVPLVTLQGVETTLNALLGQIDYTTP
jgi:Ca2+-binding RTX toxin-like protein